jgi:hypothetical protein
MAQDQQGNSLAVGDVIYIPVTITAIDANTNLLTTKTGYSGATIGPVIGPDTHKGTNPPWPNVP